MLPSLREELSLHRSAPSADGSPAWSLHDPVRNLFFRIDWLAFEILSRWHFRDPQRILEEIEARTPIETDPDDLQGVLEFLKANELLSPAGSEAAQAFAGEARRRRRGWLRWLIHHYLFFRVPLLRPDSWLARWLPLTQPLYTRGFALLTLLALATGLVLVMRQWDGFLTTMLDMFSPAAIMAYLVTLALVKFLHELGHAFTAKRMGCRVPTMGIAFIVMFPLAYTDVNDVWKLTQRRQRLAVGAAGVIVELVIAAWATLAWALLPDGTLRGAAFLLATTTWVSTLLINASPFLRFDGYFLLMDYLEMPNLHGRAFAVGKWQLRRWLFGTGDECPEVLSPRRQAGITLFAFGTWLYRLVVFTGIALLVYFMFPKPLGPALAAIELSWFIGLPLLREIANWKPLAWASVRGEGSRRWLWLLMIVFLLLAVPWDGRVRSQGMLRPESFLPVIAPGGALLVSLPDDGAPVLAGEALVGLDVPTLRTRRAAVAAKAAAVRWRADAAPFNPRERGLRDVLVADRERVEAELTGLRDELERYHMESPFDGRFFVSDPDLEVGNWVSEGEVLGRFAGRGEWVVDTYIAEEELERVQPGDRARFFSDAAGSAPVALTVTEVDRDAARTLAEPQLASSHGGRLPVRETGEGLILEQAHYRVRLRAEPGSTPDDLRELRGRVVIHGARHSLLAGYLRRAAAVFYREAGF